MQATLGPVRRRPDRRAGGQRVVARPSVHPVIGRSVGQAVRHLDWTLRVVRDVNREGEREKPTKKAGCIKCHYTERERGRLWDGGSYRQILR